MLPPQASTCPPRYPPIIEALPRGRELRGREQSFPFDDEIASTPRASPPSPPINQVLVSPLELGDADAPDDGRLDPDGELGCVCAVPVGKLSKKMQKERSTNRRSNVEKGAKEGVNYLMSKCRNLALSWLLPPGLRTHHRARNSFPGFLVKVPFQS